MSFFGKNVKKIRGVKKLSQQAFADKFDLKRATLGAYEEGRSEPKIDTIIKVANYFSISIGDILTKEITINQLLSFNEGITTDVNQMVKSSLAEIPFVNQLNKEIFITNFMQSKSYSSLPMLKVPIKETEGMLAYVVEDLIMVENQEGLFPDDIVIGKEIANDKVNKGDVVLALANESLFVRRFFKTETHYVLKADHVNIAPVEIDFADEICFWKVTEVILKRYPKFISGVENKINQIMDKLNEG